MPKKKTTFNIYSENCIAITFYPGRDGTGGPLRENLILKIKKGGHTSQRVLNRAKQKAAELGAKSFRMWILVPRVWRATEEDNED